MQSAADELRFTNRSLIIKFSRFHRQLYSIYTAAIVHGYFLIIQLRTFFARFPLDRNGYHLINYILINLEEYTLSGQFDSLDYAAGNAAVVVITKNGGWRI
jgi:hypothetical protein